MYIENGLKLINELTQAYVEVKFDGGEWVLKVYGHETYGTNLAEAINEMLKELFKEEKKSV